MVSDAGAAVDVAQFSHPRQTLLAMLAVVALAVAVRLPGIDRALVGPFATKNVVYAMIARNWVEGRASLWYPTLDCLVGGRRGLHMLEWPFSAYVTGGLWRVFGGSLDLWGRATAIAFSVASVAVLFLLVLRWHGRTAAIGAAMLLALSPVGVLYGRAFMLESSLVFFTVGTFYALDRWLAGGRILWLGCAGAALGLLLLTKIYMLVLLLPLVAMVTLSRKRERVPTPSPGEGGPQQSAGRHGTEPALTPDPSPACGRGGKMLTLAVLLVAVLPAVAWYWHAAWTAAPDNPLSAYVFYSVRQSAAVHRPPSPLLGSPDFYRQLLDDLAGVVLTPIGLVLLLAGFLDRAWRRHAAWLASAVLLVAGLPLKFYEMNYYWLAVLPPLAVMVGLGWQVVCRSLRPSRRATVGLLLVGLVFSLRYTVKAELVTPEEDRGVTAAAAAVRRLTPPGEPVVTMHGSTLDLLYYCDRPGWALAPDKPDLPSLLADYRRQGARYAVVAGTPGAQGEVACPPPLARYPEILRGNGFVVRSLVAQTPLTSGGTDTALAPRR